MARSEAIDTGLVRDRYFILGCRKRDPAARRHRLALVARLARNQIVVHHLQLRRRRPAGTFDRFLHELQTSVVFNLHRPAQEPRRSENLVRLRVNPCLWTLASLQVTPVLRLYDRGNFEQSVRSVRDDLLKCEGTGRTYTSSCGSSALMSTGGGLLALLRSLLLRPFAARIRHSKACTPSAPPDENRRGKRC